MNFKKIITLSTISTIQILILTFPLSSYGNTLNQDQEIYTLGEVVVSGNMDELTSGVESVGSVHKISQEDIKLSGARNLNEAIDLLPGVNIMIGGDAVPKIDIRGFRPRHNILLLNGIPINSTYDHQFNPSIIPVENIAEIKMTAGASSVLYGQGGIGGVINIITKKGSDGLKGSIGAEAGQGNSFMTKATVSGKKDKLDFFSSADISQRDAFPLSHDFESTPLEGGRFRNNSDKRTGSMFTNIGYSPTSNLTTGLTMNYLAGEYGIPVAVVSGDIFAPNKKFERVDGYDGYSLQAAAEYFPEDTPLTIRGWIYYNRMNEAHNRYADNGYTSYTDNPLIITYTLDNKTTVKGVSLQPRYDFTDKGTLTIGLSAQQDSWESTGTAWNQWSPEWPPQYLPVDVHDKKDIAVYSIMAEYEHLLFSILGITIGYGFHYQDRHQTTEIIDIDHPDIIIATTPESDQDHSFLIGSYVDVTKNTRIKAVFQRNVRFPSIRQLYDVDAGNPELITEIALHYSAGIEQELPEKIHITATVFHTRAENFIEKDSRRSEQFENFNYYLFTGAETTAEVGTIENLTLRTCYSFLMTEDKTGSGRDELQYRPKHRVTLESKYHFSWGLIPYISCVYMADQSYYEKGGNPREAPEKAKLNDYAIVNLRLNYRFRKKYTLYVGADNLLDENYEQSYGYPMSGRYIYGGGELQF